MAAPTVEDQAVLESPDGCLLARRLPIARVEKAVFRAVALSIVLTLAVSPSALLCGMMWCEQTVGLRAAPVDECHHGAPGTAASLTGTDPCRHMSRDTAFLREDARRSTFGPDVHAVVGVRGYFALSTTENSSLFHPRPDWSFDERPLITALRI